MLSSGNGRHRRPRQAPAAMVTVAATGAGIALPLLGAGAAHAADSSTWDKVAICETGGLWSADPSNGFYGGLAITQDTWNAYGGQAYAPRPDLASRTEQIAVAEQMLADLGPNAWPGCEDGTGLLDAVTPPVAGGTPAATPTTPAPSASTPPSGDATTGGSGGSGGTGGSNTDPSLPTIIPTAPGTDTPTGPADGSTVTPVTPTAPTAPVTPTSPGDGSRNTPGSPTADAPATPGTGRHAKPYVPTDAELAAADQATRTELTAVTDAGADSGTDTGKGSDDGSTGATGASDTGHSADGGHDYTVAYGDSLAGIASSHHVQGGWSGLYDANRQVIGQDPNLIKPGQILTLDLG
ncbi:transglycosylase family protein [Streptomyces sp. NPDC088910]|uniref:transglycosylase family protein n=1 Tax=Streptomyces sp. NPDC088910 TaxID=3365911 RepID=UPI0038200BBE